MSLLFSVSMISGWVLEIPSGAFSDWFGRKKAFLLGKFIYLLGMLSLFISYKKPEINIYFLSFCT
ncbi:MULTISPECIES: hypothetical protein [unclassified Bacillus cereus group]|uniref:hypothetical protein n=1 Tax=unclassified Bacillus cereus group TaxID=2750818 RepID=UPI001F55B034|nr:MULTISPECIES: hypothetical protein [unclassified Bacillus cereus group]